jgi:phage/plasmid primase-like uncharacterized protein
MSLGTIFMLKIECPKCGKIHQFSVDGVVERGTIYCGCGETIIVNNASQFVKKIDELERPSPQVALSTIAEKKEEKVEKPKVEKQPAEMSKTEKLKEAKPKEKETRNKKSKKYEAKN